MSESHALEAIEHLSQATAQIWQSEAALRKLGDPGKAAIEKISQLRYALHDCKRLIPKPEQTAENVAKLAAMAGNKWEKTTDPKTSV